MSSQQDTRPRPASNGVNKIYLVSGLVALSLLSAEFSLAQTYSVVGGGTIAQTGTSACINLYRDLSHGSRGSDVTSLQNFLVGQNYPGSGSWMVTGYFGSATRQAVMNFQGQKGIASTGVVDAQTRTAIQNSACGQTYTTYPSSTSYVNTYTSTYTNTYNNNLSINSLSVTSGAVGTSVTIYGNGFDPVYNNVYFGNIPVVGNIASNGTSLTFTVPYSYTPSCGGVAYCFTNTQNVGPGVYHVHVTNSRGTSNSVPFTIPGGSPSCSLYAGYGNCGYGYGYGNYGAYSNVNISSILPYSGAVGSSVTILGSGFSRRGNAVHFGTGIITDLTSMDGTSLSFIVPSQLTGYGSQSLTTGTYSVSVSNENGVTSNVVPFTVTSLAWNTFLPIILSVNGPASLSTGTQGVWTVTVNNQNSFNVVLSAKWGDEGMIGVPVSYSQTITTGGAQTLTFTHTYRTGGNYPIEFTITNNSGAKSTSTAFVTVYPIAGNTLSLSSVSPLSGRVGTLSTLIGTGFTQSGNTVHFGNGGAANLTSSNNGTVLYYTIPYSVSPCDISLIGGGSACTAPTTLVTTGTYPIYISNATGQTATLNFTVTP